MFSASYFIYSLITARGARVSSTSPQYAVRTSYSSGLFATWAECQQSVVYDATDQWRERLETCIDAEDGHFEHWL